MAEAIVIVGKEEIKRICGILDLASGNEVVISEFKTNWALLAIDLCNELEKMKWIKSGLRTGQLSLTAAFKEILGNWVDWSKDEATLESLLSFLVTNKMATYAGIIATEFSMESWKANIPLQEESIINGTGRPVTKALENAVILTEIFKMLSYKDRRNFRLVNRLWMRETLASWRQRYYLIFYAEESESRRDQLTMQKYFKLCSAEPTAENSFSLLSPPYLHCRLKEQLLWPFANGITEEEKFFWETFASELTHLKLYRCRFYKGTCFETIQWILLKRCQNLKEIKLEGSELCNSSSPGKVVAVTRTPENPHLICQLNSYTEDGSNRHFLNEEETTNILKMLPKLKTLETCRDTEVICKSLLQPTNNGDFIALHKLLFRDFEHGAYQSSLRNYIEQSSHPLKELQIRFFVWKNQINKMFAAYDALAQCSKLLVLKLQYCEILDRNPEPFFNLGNITFSELTKLFLNVFQEEKKFDFGSLRNLPKLVTLMVSYGSTPIDIGDRRQGGGDWINEGDRLQYTAEGLRMQHASGQPIIIKCESLQNFFFDGWLLNLTDLQLFGDWFPNLIFLQGKFGINAFPQVFNRCKNIKTVSVLEGSRIRRPELDDAKREHKDVNVVVENRSFCNFDNFS